MEDCYICYNKCANIHRLMCNHSLCYDCYMKLTQSTCPFCRQVFAYTQNEMHLRCNISDTQVQYTTVFSSHYDIPEPFSRVRRNCIRKRRRNLTMDEVLDRRQYIRKRCVKKWTRKNGRLEKINSGN
jgi:hypothetical protein